EFVGGVRGKPVDVIKAPVIGLPIPAQAEIVIEGFVAPGNERVEGPFGEWTGYYASDVRPEPVLDIKAVYYRNDPILLGCVPQRPPDEICRYRAVVRSALLRENIAKAGVPGVTAAWAHAGGNARLLLAVAVNQRYPGHAMSRPCATSAPIAAATSSSWTTTSTCRTSKSSYGPCSRAPTLRLRSTSSATPGRPRSTRASSPSAKRPAITPTAGRSSTPAGPGTGATNFPR